MLERFRSLVIAVSLIVVMAGLAAFFLTQMGGGSKLFGEKQGSLSPTDFETLAYTPDKAGYLLCSPSLCKNAEADGNSELFDISARRLTQLVADFADQMPTVKTIKVDLANSQFDFTERLPGQSYPSVVSVRVVKTGQLSSAMAIYSYQPVGKSTSKDHEERVERWIHQLRSRLEKP
ncbi:hypothetical protein [Kordiimonas marina]|uniref:hypothetical protein n=1 Tax=Kordiimonas marina TaxID=2872312 RepID=UPI001FF4A771|nr:hypothetical protein [Kordiimonas marina]MCJ9428455.1 hypothetical protein [Kordiimonas marina]